MRLLGDFRLKTDLTYFCIGFGGKIIWGHIKNIVKVGLIRKFDGLFLSAGLPDLRCFWKTLSLCLAIRLSFWLTKWRLESFDGMNLFVREVSVEWRSSHSCTALREEYFPLSTMFWWSACFIPSKFAFLYGDIDRGFWKRIYAEVLTWIWTMTWSLIPGRKLTRCTRVGFVVKKWSRLLESRVDRETVWVRFESFSTSVICL